MRAWSTEPQPLPNGRAPARPLYAIGDAHGHSDALAALFRLLADRIRSERAGAAVDVVVLGDLVDRGPDPRGCLSLAAEGVDAPGARTIALLGNHDWFLAAAAGLRGLRLDQTDWGVWMDNGGVETAEALGLSPSSLTPEAVRAALGGELCALIEGMPLSFATGDVFCAHAGVRPERAIADQSEEDLIWIREPFLSAGADPAHPWPLGVTVVHGHTPRAWGVFPHRIGADAGGYQSGLFTAVEVDSEGVRLHCVARS